MRTARSLRFFSLAAFIAAGGAAAQDTCTYKGADKGGWNNAANWTCGVVPANGNGFTYNAIIPVNLTVNFDLPGYTELTGFNLSSNATLKLDGQQLKVPFRQLGDLVVGQAKRPNLLLGQVGRADRRHFGQPDLPRRATKDVAGDNHAAR